MIEWLALTLPKTLISRFHELFFQADPGLLRVALTDADPKLLEVPLPHLHLNQYLPLIFTPTYRRLLWPRQRPTCWPRPSPTVWTATCSGSPWPKLAKTPSLPHSPQPTPTFWLLLSLTLLPTCSPLLSPMLRSDCLELLSPGELPGNSSSLPSPGKITKTQYQWRWRWWWSFWPGQGKTRWPQPWLLRSQTFSTSLSPRPLLTFLPLPLR